VNAALERIRDIIQEDIGNRGLAKDPEANLINACPGDFAAACRSIASASEIAIATGFWIPTASTPFGPGAAETDGPLGAMFLARALVPLGIKITFLTDCCLAALYEGGATGFEVKVVDAGQSDSLARFEEHLSRVSHLIALERVGPSHTLESLRAQGASNESVDQFVREVPREHHDRCHNMRGVDITDVTAPIHTLFEAASRRTPPITTIGIGDGGNEIGMGKIPWDTIRRNIPNGGLIACRVPTNYLIVAGVSNWGAYGLAAGVRLLRSADPFDPELFDVERERQFLQAMVEEGPLVDGVTGRQSVSVDGLDFDRYASVLRRIGEIGLTT
jgi:hypothetical protein